MGKVNRSRAAERVAGRESRKAAAESRRNGNHSEARLFDRQADNIRDRLRDPGTTYNGE